MKYNFATLFDKNYLTRGLALLYSLDKYVSDFTLHILCLDEQAQDFLIQKNHPNLKVFTLKDIENYYPELQCVKKNRSAAEYYFTLSPYLPLYVINNYSDISSICTLDADILFFSSPEPIFHTLETRSIIITPHKYAHKLEASRLEVYGKYNVSFQIFKNNATGLACLNQWRQQCLEWCYDFFDENSNRYADQKYLDTWVKDFPNEVFELSGPTTGLAVWNIDSYSIKYQNQQITIDGEPLIFYHYHNFKIIKPSFALNGFSLYNVTNNSNALISGIYKEYWNLLEKYDKQVKIKTDNFLRENSNLNFLMLLLTQRTAFVKIFSGIYKVNFTFASSILKKIKSIYGIHN